MAAAFSQQQQGAANTNGRDSLNSMSREPTLYIHPTAKLQTPTQSLTKFFILQHQQHGIAALEVNEQTDSVVLLDRLDRTMGRGHGGLSKRNAPGTYEVDEMTFNLILQPGTNRIITATITSRAAIVSDGRNFEISRRANPVLRSTAMFITEVGTNTLIATCEVYENSVKIVFQKGNFGKYVKALILILMLKQCYFLPFQIQHSPMPIISFPEPPAPIIHLEIFLNLRNLRFQLACRNPETGAYYMNIIDADTSRRILVVQSMRHGGHAHQRIHNIHGEEQVIGAYEVNQPNQGVVEVWTPDGETEIGTINKIERRRNVHRTRIINNNEISPQLEVISVPSAQPIFTEQEIQNRTSYDYIISSSASRNQVARIYVDQYTVVLSILDNNMMATDIALIISFVSYLCFNIYGFHKRVKIAGPYPFLMRV